jgi:hypothetical protein
MKQRTQSRGNEPKTEKESQFGEWKTHTTISERNTSKLEK